MRDADVTRTHRGATGGATTGARSRRGPWRGGRGKLIPVIGLVFGAAALVGCGTTPHSAAPAGAPNTATGAAAPTAGSSGGASSAAPLERSVPVRLEIPRLGVNTSIIPLGLASDGTIDVPPIEANSPAGWYENSPTPGQIGPSVILGHVTVGQFGDGVFLHLAEMQAGDRIQVHLADGATATFTVDSVDTVAKTAFPTSQVYGNIDHPGLRLITCGGPKDTATHSYPDNVIVYASLD